MSMEWFKMYHNMPSDPKLQVIAKRAAQPMAHVVAVWSCVLDAASQHEPRGMIQLDAEEIAVVQDIDLEAVQAIIKTFYVKGMIDEKHRLTNWNKRQGTTSTERSQKHRAIRQQDATPSNAAQREAAGATAAQRKNMQKDTDRDKIREEREGEKELDKDLRKRRTREEKKEREKEKQTSGGKEILEQMLDIWNEEVQSKLTPNQKAKLTPKRKEQMTCRWLEDFQQDMRAWRYYCQIIGASEFCLGKLAGKGWTIDLSWAVESTEHVTKILEGGFSGGNHPPKPPACEVPSLQAAWDTVLHAFQTKHGKAACRSWLANTAVTQMDTYRDGAVITLRCPGKFIAEWLTQHYLADISRWFAEATQPDIRVARVELVTEG